MAHEIKIPPFGESITETTVAQWLKKDGERVAKGDNLVTIDTEKASSDLQAEVAGVLRIAVAAGTDATVGSVIGTIEEVVQDEPVAAKIVEIPKLETREPRDPAAIVEVHGSDTRESAAEPRPDVPAQPSEPPPPIEAPGSREAPVAPPPPGERETRQPMSRLRRTLAKRLLEARNGTAMLTSFNEVDMSGVLSIRNRFQEQFQKTHGVKLGFMSFFMKAAVEALKAFPVMNATIDGDDVVYHHYHDLGVAVSTERGLVVPVIRDVDRKSFGELEQELAELAARAREGKLDLDELKGGTFTITNGGVFGSLMSTPLLNPPQVGILGMHTIQERPVAIEGRVEIRPMMYLALSYDHRLIDGREAVLFLTHIREHIASPERILLGL